MSLEPAQPLRKCFLEWREVRWHRAARAQRSAPDRGGEMGVAAEARDHVPVQMRDCVPEAGEIDLVGTEQFPQPRLQLEYDAHQARSLAFAKVGHFGNVSVPDRAAKAGITGLLHADYAALLVAPDELAAVTLTQFARHAVNDER